MTDKRQALVTEALSWIGTPYDHGQMVKGAGCDCGTFMLGVLRYCGLALSVEIDRYVHDWFCHTKDQRYLRDMMRNAKKVAEAISYETLMARPGDLVLTRSVNSPVYNHGGIVVAWPKIVHAIHPVVELCDATAHELWCYRTVVVFDPFELGEKA